MKEETFINTGKFIHAFNDIESYINLIITHHIEPKDKSFFLDYILNTSVISFGAKIKILINLNIFKTVIKDIREYSSNRNVFAHKNRDTFFVESVTETEPNEITIAGSDVIFKTNSEGKVVKMDYKEFIEKHVLLQNKIIDFICEYVSENNIDTLYNHVENLKIYKV